MQTARPITFSVNIVRSLNTLNTLNEEWHIVRNLNKNLYENDALFREKNKNIVKETNKISSEAISS